MIKASEKFKDNLREALQATAGVLELPNLSPLQRHYYGGIWELLQRLEAEIEAETGEKPHEADDRERREREAEIMRIDLQLFVYAREQRYTLGDKFYRKFAQLNALILDYGKTYGTEAQERLREKLDTARTKAEREALVKRGAREP